MSERVVAWMSDSEWMKVYEKIFYGNPETQREALDVINIWRVRFFGRIPVAIEATARLVEAVLERPKVCEGAQRQLFSASITQFIGLITERGLKSQTRRPIHAVGEDLGIPEWIVNLRHEMAHGPLPSMLMLEKAVYFALSWIKDRHWDVQAENIASLSVNVKNTHITEEDFFFLEADLSKVLDHHLSKSTDKSVKYTSKQFSGKIASILSNNPVGVQVLASVIVTRGYLAYPAFDFSFSQPSFNLPKKYHKFWKPVIQIMQDFSYLPGFFLCIVSCLHLNNHNYDNQNILILWAQHLVDMFIEQYDQGFVAKHSQKDGEIWMDCIRLLAKSANPYMATIYKKLSALLKILVGEEKASLLNELHDIQTSAISQKSATPNSETNLNSKICTLADCMQVDISEKSNATTISNCGTWSLYEGENLEHCTIGLMPGQNLMTLSLELTDMNYKETSPSFNPTGTILGSVEMESESTLLHESIDDSLFSPESLDMFSSVARKVLDSVNCGATNEVP